MAGSSSASSSSSAASSAPSSSSTRNLTAIELERLENIKANQAVLASVGLGSTRRPGSSFHDDDDEAAAAARRKAQKRQKPPPRPPSEPTRRSSRNLGRDAPDYREDAIALSNLTSSSFTSSRHTWKAGKDEEELGPGEEWYSTTTAAAAAAAGRVSATPGSSRGRDADVQFALKEYLGKKVPYTGKQCVMDLLTPKGGGREGGPVKFSKYAGVVEWRNCVLLWVNVDGNDYENLWLEGGRRLTWFAGSRVKPETPVMVRLLAAGREGGREGGKEGEEGGEEKEEREGGKREGKEGGKGDKPAGSGRASEKKKERGKEGEEEEEEEEEEGGKKGEVEEEGEEKEDILLFCRRQGEPYVCMGRVWHVWFDTRTHPIKVLWKLRDWEEIKGEEDVREVVGKVVEEEEEEGKEGKRARVK